MMKKMKNNNNPFYVLYLLNKNIRWIWLRICVFDETYLCDPQNYLDIWDGTDNTYNLAYV